MAECPRCKFKFVESHTEYVPFVDCHTEYDNSSFTTFWFKDIYVLH